MKKECKNLSFHQGASTSVSSGAEEGHTNVYVLPLTKETLSVILILTSSSSGNRRRMWTQDLFGDVLDVVNTEEDIISLAVSGCW